MSLTATRWDSISVNTASTWFTIANPSGPAIINTLSFCAGANQANLQLQIINSSSTVVATLISSTTPMLISPGVNGVWNGCPITLNAGDKLQYYLAAIGGGSVAGISFSAHGAT